MRTQKIQPPKKDEPTEHIETVKIGLREIDVYPDWCARKPRKCVQCDTVGRMACAPQFRIGLTPPKEVAVAALLRRGKRPLQVHAETGVSFEYIYNVSRNMRRRGILERRNTYDHSQREKILAFIKEHPTMFQYRIAQKFKVSQSYISALCREQHLGREQQTDERNTKITRALAIRVKDKDRTLASIAEEIGMAESTLRHHLRGKTTRNPAIIASIRQEVRAAIAEIIPELVAQLRQILKEAK
jgi:AraC-like DNA-binding protein